MSTLVIKGLNGLSAKSRPVLSKLVLYSKSSQLALNSVNQSFLLSYFVKIAKLKRRYFFVLANDQLLLAFNEIEMIWNDRD